MGRNNYFRFKQFKVVQNHAAMKVGTDGVLLGAWVNTENASSILDVGTGTGLIALMLAQRTNAFITGIDIEEKAAMEAVTNILASPWSQRIRIINISLQNFLQSINNKFDLIVSNPPFFSNSQKSKIENLAIAKHNDFLPFDDLIFCCSKLLNDNGRFALIIPCQSYNEIQMLSQKANLTIIRKTLVKPTPMKKGHRLLIQLAKTEFIPIEMDVIHIHDDTKQDFSQEFKTLISPFYLHY